MYKKVAVVILLIVIVSETVVRLFVTSPSNQTFDPELGWVYIPHTRVLHAKEGFAVNTINNLGFNDDEFVYNASKRHMLFLGDSFTEAFHVDKKYNFTSLLEDENTVSVNAAQASLNPLHYLTIFRRLKDVVHPDTVVLVLSTGDLNDMVSTPMNVDYTRDGKIKKVTVISGNKDNLKRYAEPITQNSALATFLMRRMKPLAEDILRRWMVRPSSASIAGTVYLPSKTEDQKKILLSYVLKELKNNASLHVLYVPRIGFGVNGMLPPSRGIIDEYTIISETADENGINCFTAQTYLEDVYLKSGMPPFGFNNSIMGEGHLNIRGHEAVANAIRDHVFIGQ